MIIDIVILCPIEVEFKFIRKILKNSNSHFIRQDKLAFDLGQMDGLDFIWNVAVIGPNGDAKSFEIKTHEALRVLKPKYILLAGVAGGIKDVKIGDILIGTKAYGYESGKETNEGFVARPDAITNDSEQLLALARKICREIEEDTLKIYFGSIASGKKVIGTTKSGIYEIIKRHYNDSLGVEKEAFVFASRAREFKTAYLNIRCISDMLDGKAQSDAEGNQDKASKKIAWFLKRFIANLPLDKQSILHSSTVYTTSQKFPSSLYRKQMIKSKLLFKNDFIEWSTDKEHKTIRNILELEHLKMPGDFSKNWIRVKFEYDNSVDEVYFSSSTPLGKGAWFGSSKQLLEKFKAYQLRQVPIS